MTLQLGKWATNMKQVIESDFKTRFEKDLRILGAYVYAVPKHGYVDRTDNLMYVSPQNLYIEP